MRTRLLLVALFVASLAAADNKLTVRSVPAFVQPGGAVRITCRVQPDAENRKVEFGVDGYTSSTRDLDGESARITHEWTFEHVPCGAGPAFCTVTRADRKSRRVVAPLEVVGCDGTSSH